VLWGACEPGSVKVNQTRELAAHGLNQASGPNTPIVARMGLRWDEGAICDFESTMDWQVTGAYMKRKGDWACTMNKIKQFITNTTYFFQFHQPTYSQGVNRMPHKNNIVARATAKPPESPEYTLATNYVILYSSMYICMKKQKTRHSPADSPSRNFPLQLIPENYLDW